MIFCISSINNKNKMVKFQTYSINNLILTKEVLDSYITNFWNDIFTSVKDNKHLMLMCKVEFNESEKGYRTLGHLRRVNFDDKELFIEYLISRLGILNDSYVSHPISKITFTYIIKDGLASGNRMLLQDLSEKSITKHIFNNMNLPISMNPADYGNLESDSFIELNGVSFHRFIITSGSKIFRLDRSFDRTLNKVTILGNIDLSWIDTKISDEVFTREIGKSLIYFMDGERVLTKKQLNAKPFRKLCTDSKLNNKFVTMDIETIKIDSKLSPYLICAYNGIDYITSYANKSLDQKSLFNSFINQLLDFFKKDNVLVVYAHNLSGFYGIFLLKHLFDYGKVEPLLFNGKLMSIKVKLNIEGYNGKTIIFKDSYLLLPMSLRKLCSAFDVSVNKSFFPFILTDIFYKGLLPKFEFWIGISLREYLSIKYEYTAKTWNFKDEAIKYCKLDCKCLFEVLVNFNKLIFKHFKVNINISLTLPALAMRIYKSQFMPKDTIYQLLGNVEKDIRQSYTGGAVDVFIPHNRMESIYSRLFTKLFSYDVNSLYPFVMANTAMPVGKPIAFQGDIRKMEPNAYGYFYCKITSPEFLLHPILQRRIKTSNGLRTIAGLGSREGWIYSAEMDNAIKLGYTFEILNGYQFEKGYIFKEYVDKMYALRLEFEKGDPMNLIAKLLMNSLYGKFGMKLESTLIEICDTSCDTQLTLFNEMLEVYGESVIDFVKIDHRILTIRQSMIHYKYNENDDMYHGQDVNIAIASAVTAGARMWMSILKNNPLFKLFYSDTDSIVINKQLPSYMVGEELGQFKLEYVINRAVYLAPKVYGFIDENGNEIVKVKGVAKEHLKDFHIQDLEKLLFKDASKEFVQSKWFKKVLEGDITINEVAYTLKITSNKRAAIYIDDIFENTKPFNYNEIEDK
jgi:hypothetical protein